MDEFHVTIRKTYETHVSNFRNDLRWLQESCRENAQSS